MTEKINEIYVETMVGANLSNGVVRIFLANQNLSDILEKGADMTKVKTDVRHCITMPLVGFLYALTVLEKMTSDEGFKTVVQQAIKAGLAPEKFPDAINQ